MALINCCQEPVLGIDYQPFNIDKNYLPGL